MSELTGRHYVFVVDYYSRYFKVITLSTTTSKAVIAVLQRVFARFEAPTVVVSDNGPQFASQDFASFTSRYGFHHVTSSPRYPQANGEAERIVRTVKDLLRKARNPYCSSGVSRHSGTRRVQSSAATDGPSPADHGAQDGEADAPEMAATGALPSMGWPSAS